MTSSAPTCDPHHRDGPGCRGTGPDVAAGCACRRRPGRNRSHSAGPREPRRGGSALAAACTRGASRLVPGAGRPDFIPRRPSSALARVRVANHATPFSPPRLHGRVRSFRVGLHRATPLPRPACMGKTLPPLRFHHARRSTHRRETGPHGPGLRPHDRPASDIEFRAKWANGASVDEHLDATGCALAWAIIQTQDHKAASPNL